MASAHRRFDAWLRWTKKSTYALGRELGCAASYLSHIRAGRRVPGRTLANAIERLSGPWPKGPIRSSEWDAAAAKSEAA